MEQLTVIDAHAHLGEFGGWANVGISDDQMISYIDRFNIDKTVVFTTPNDIVHKAVQKYQ
jgi:hypothetical protein